MDLGNAPALLLPQQEEENTLPDNSVEGSLLIDEAEKHGEEVEESRRNDDDGDGDGKEAVSEGDFVDAENMLENKITTSFNSSFPAIRARISDDIDDEEDEA